MFYGGGALFFFFSFQKVMNSGYQIIQWDGAENLWCMGADTVFALPASLIFGNPKIQGQGELPHQRATDPECGRTRAFCQ